MFDSIRRAVAARSDFTGRPDPDFGTALSSAGDAAPPPLSEAAERAMEERLVASVERLDQVKEGMEAALHPHEAQRIDIGGAATGFVRGVLVRVLAHILARSVRSPDDPPRPR